jgi:cellobiose phosphorylase
MAMIIPKEVLEGQLKRLRRQRLASHCRPSNRFDVLKPGESRKLVFILGYVEVDPEKKFSAPGLINKAPAEELISHYNTVEKAEVGLSETSFALG